MADDYQDRLERSGRDKRLAALVAALLALGVSDYDGTPETLGSAVTAIGAAARPILDRLAAEAGDQPLDVEAVWSTFIGNVQTYLSQAQSLPAEELPARIRLILQDQLHRAEFALVQQSAKAAGTQRMQRIVHPEASISGPCPICLQLEGEYDADDPDLYYSHPWCCCEVRPVAADEASSMSETLYFSDVPQAERDALAAKGQALKGGSYPIADKAHLKAAITLAQSGHGDVKAAKALIKKRAKDLDAEDMLPEGFSDMPDTSDVHVNGIVNSSGGSRPTRHFLKKMLDKLKGKVSAAEFDEAVKHARGHAGGMAAAANRKQQLSAAVMPGMKASEYPWTDNDSAYLPDSAVADSDGDNDADDGAQPKLEKADARVKYRDAVKVTETCGHCRFFHEDEGACRIVEGFIRQDGVCNLFSPIVVDLGAVAASEPTVDEAFFFSEPRFYMEPPARIPYLPKPGNYVHPSYGKVIITPERNQRFLDNFKTGVYQEELPIDAEHQSKLSGACGYVTDLVMNEDKSVDAIPRWTPRGMTMLRNDSFSSFSPEFYDEWTDPATGQVHKDVAIGGALTTRPFFKSKSLRPLAASEHVLVGFFAPREERQMAEDEKTEKKAESPEEEKKEEATMATEPGAFAEQLAQRDAQIAALKAMTERQDTESKRMAEAFAAMEKSSRAKQFTDEVLGRSDASSARWYGSVEEHVSFMETLHTAGLEDQLNQYIEQNRTHAEQLRTSGLFREYGRAGTSGTAKTAAEKLEAMIAAAEAGGLDKAAATDKVMSENPQLYGEYSQTRSFGEGD